MNTSIDRCSVFGKSEYLEVLNVGCVVTLSSTKVKLLNRKADFPVAFLNGIIAFCVCVFVTMDV
jgi:hypothetical protein